MRFLRFASLPQRYSEPTPDFPIIFQRPPTNVNSSMKYSQAARNLLSPYPPSSNDSLRFLVGILPPYRPFIYLP